MLFARLGELERPHHVEHLLVVLDRRDRPDARAAALSQRLHSVVQRCIGIALAQEVGVERLCELRLFDRGQSGRECLTEEVTAVDAERPVGLGEAGERGRILGGDHGQQFDQGMVTGVCVHHGSIVVSPSGRRIHP